MKSPTATTTTWVTCSLLLKLATFVAGSDAGEMMLYHIKYTIGFRIENPRYFIGISRNL